jgi:hypothetical protein
MDWLEFVASVVATVAWPIVVLVLVFAFKQSIVDSLRQLRHLKAPGVEADFGGFLADAEKSTEALLDAAGVPNEEAPEQPPQPPLDPTGLIIRAWQILTMDIARLTSAAGLTKKNARNAIDQLEELRKALPMDPAVVATVLDLRNLRNLVAHGRHTPTEGEAFTYAETAHELSTYLNFMMKHALTHTSNS